MSNLGERKNGNAPFNVKRTTKKTSKKLEVGSSPEQLEILSVKEHNGQIMIEFRAPSTSETSIAGTGHETTTTNQAVQDKLAEIEVGDEFGQPTISVQSIPPTDAERRNFQTVTGGCTAIKVEDDEMEFCAEFCVSSTAQFIPENDHEIQITNQPFQDKLAEIKVEEIELGEPSISVQSISTTYDDECKEIEDKMEFCDEVEIDALNIVPGKSDEPDGNKMKSEFTCDICSKKYSKRGILIAHRIRHRKPRFHCPVCDVAKITKSELTYHMWSHDSNSCFKCDVCWKKFSTQDRLVKHRLSHDKKKFPCTVCGAVKCSQYVFDRHMRTHDTIRNFTCEFCPKRFTDKIYLNRHRKCHDKTNCNLT